MQASMLVGSLCKPAHAGVQHVSLSSGLQGVPGAGGAALGPPHFKQIRGRAKGDPLCREPLCRAPADIHGSSRHPNVCAPSGALGNKVVCLGRGQSMLEGRVHVAMRAHLPPHVAREVSPPYGKAGSPCSSAVAHCLATGFKATPSRPQRSAAACYGFLKSVLFSAPKTWNRELFPPS